MTGRSEFLGSPSRIALALALGATLASSRAGFTSPAMAQVAVQADGCVAQDEDDVGMLILQGLAGLASQSAASETKQRKNTDNQSTEQAFGTIEIKVFAALEDQISNTLAGSASFDDKYDWKTRRSSAVRRMNESLQAFMGAIVGFRVQFPIGFA